MRFGLTYDFRNPPGNRRPYEDLYEDLIDQIVLAEELGYDEVWLTEHHFTEVKSGDQLLKLDGPHLTVELQPGTGTRLTFKMKRYTGTPTMSFPWNFAPRGKD